jgi:hypothetical protein
LEGFTDGIIRHKVLTELKKIVVQALVSAVSVLKVAKHLVTE